ncbi:hypothetical protein JCM11491_001600 [Sporobolomyces phaffii]
MSTSKPRKPSLLESSRPTLDPSPRVPPQLYQPEAPNLPTCAPAPASSSSASGAPKAPHGNYLYYYERRHSDPDARDARLSLVPSEWLRGKTVLDVGSNAGHVSIELARDYAAAAVTAVDIDKDLTRKAKGNLDLAWSRQAPLKRLLDESDALSSARKRRSRSPSTAASTSSASVARLEPLPTDRSLPSPFATRDPHYFPASLGRMFGYLPPPRGLLSYHVQPAAVPVPASSAVPGFKKGKKASNKREWPVEVKAFPENVKLATADWVNDEVDSDREGYDVVIAFSVTKWIHLQSLNAGLLAFFEKCFATLKPGGRLVLEPQPFSTYARSAKTSAALRDNYEALKGGAQNGWRWELGDFERVLIELVGFEKREALGETGTVGSTFRRPVEVYTKRGGAPANTE